MKKTMILLAVILGASSASANILTPDAEILVSACRINKSLDEEIFQRYLFLRQTGIPTWDYSRISNDRAEVDSYFIVKTRGSCEKIQNILLNTIEEVASLR